MLAYRSVGMNRKITVLGAGAVFHCTSEIMKDAKNYSLGALDSDKRRTARGKRAVREVI